jgi:ubiquinol-cytochrome c reductase cytochrome b subunit
MPFVILVLVILHLIFLHETGSTNIIGTSSDIDKIIFHPFFSLKDLFSFLVVISLFLLIVLEVPYKLGDPENFILANPLVTPIHIQPEWYLLFAYSILRAIPNKLGGVVALALSIIILFRLSLIIKTSINRSRFLPTNKFLF